MKLTEKELNEFPIGTKITIGKNVYIKADKNIAETYPNWFAFENVCWATNKELLNEVILKIEIPTYAEYIPPKPILDDKEKEYLSAVIRPFRNKIKSIQKDRFKKEEYIHIFCDKFSDSFGLPYFKKGTMYKGMELDKEYTLEELRIIID